MWIMKNNEVDSIIKLPILEDYIQIIALICYAHNEEFLTLSKEFYKSTQVNNDIIQVNILSYLLRVGDALDADKRRCKIEVLKLKNINVNSKIHWYKHYFTKSVKCENKNVSILFEFTDDEDWLDCMEEYFINETSQWIINNSDELIETKIFGDNIRNNFLKYKVESDKKYAIKQSMDKETRQAIIDIISSKKKL